MSDCSYMLLNINALKNKEESCGKKNTAFDIAGQFGSCIYILLKRVFIQSPRLQVVSHQ